MGSGLIYLSPVRIGTPAAGTEISEPRNVLGEVSAAHWNVGHTSACDRLAWQLVLVDPQFQAERELGSGTGCRDDQLLGVLDPNAHRSTSGFPA